MFSIQIFPTAISPSASASWMTTQPASSGSGQITPKAPLSKHQRLSAALGLSAGDRATASGHGPVAGDHDVTMTPTALATQPHPSPSSTTAKSAGSGALQGDGGSRHTLAQTQTLKGKPYQVCKVCTIGKLMHAPRFSYSTKDNGS